METSQLNSAPDDGGDLSAGNYLHYFWFYVPVAFIGAIIAGILARIHVKITQGGDDAVDENAASEEVTN